MPGLEVLMPEGRMSILQCEELAKKLGFDRVTFDLCGPKGSLSAQWVDAYMGMFRVGEDLIMASQVALASNLWCENIRVEDPTFLIPRSAWCRKEGEPE